MPRKKPILKAYIRIKPPTTSCDIITLANNNDVTITTNLPLSIPNTGYLIRVKGYGYRINDFLSELRAKNKLISCIFV